MAPTIVGLGGSLASASRSRAALRTALDGAAAAGAETQLLDLRELALPMYNPDDDEPTEAAAELIESCYAADGLLWSSPLYQGTISGALKNALDTDPGRVGRAPARDARRRGRACRRTVRGRSLSSPRDRMCAGSRTGGDVG